MGPPSRSQGESRARDGREGEAGFSGRLPKDEVQYYEEIDKQLSKLEDGEEQRLLADNAFEQAGTQLIEATGDGVVSRVLEKLMPHASTQALIDMLTALTSGENLAAVCTGCVWVDVGALRMRRVGPPCDLPATRMGSRRCWGCGPGPIGVHGPPSHCFQCSAC